MKCDHTANSANSNKNTRVKGAGLNNFNREYTKKKIDFTVLFIYFILN